MSGRKRRAEFLSSTGHQITKWRQMKTKKPPIFGTSDDVKRSVKQLTKKESESTTDQILLPDENPYAHPTGLLARYADLVSYVRSKKEVDRRRIKTDRDSPPPVDIFIDYHDSERVAAIRNKGWFKKFRRNSDLPEIRHALRTKFAWGFAKSYAVGKEIYISKCAAEFGGIYDFQNRLPSLFIHFTDRFLRRAMGTMEEYQTIFRETVRLRKELEWWLETRSVVNMKILYLENQLKRAVMLQNFLYMMAHQEWRLDHDWIHRKPNGELKDFRESIQTRDRTHVRAVEDDNAYGVKEFIETEFVNLDYPLLQPFQTVRQFRKNLTNIKFRCFNGMAQLTGTMMAASQAEIKFERFKVWNEDILNKSRRIIERLKMSRIFYRGRTEQLRGIVKKLTSKKMMKKTFLRKAREIEALLDVVLIELMPDSEVFKTLIHCYSTEDKISLLTRMVHELIMELDSYPSELTFEIRRSILREKRHNLQKAQAAFNIETRFNNMITSIRKNLEPPYEKPHVKPPMPRSLPPPKPKKEVPKKREYSEYEILFAKAFTDSKLKDIDMELKENREIIRLVERACLPFYYDHWLRVRFNYYPAKDFKTEVELRDGDEEDLLKDKTLLPTVKKELEKWKLRRDKTKWKHIAQTPFLYTEDDY